MRRDEEVEMPPESDQRPFEGILFGVLVGAIFWALVAASIVIASD